MNTELIIMILNVVMVAIPVYCLVMIVFAIKNDKKRNKTTNQRRF